MDPFDKGKGKQKYTENNFDKGKGKQKDTENIFDKDTSENYSLSSVETDYPLDLQNDNGVQIAIWESLKDSMNINNGESSKSSKKRRIH